MKKYFFNKIMIGVMCLGGLFITSCEDIDPLIESLEFDRLFSPVGIEGNLSKVVELNLAWREVRGAESYKVELYKDSLLYDEANLVYRTEQTATKFAYVLEGDTRYSVRIMAVGSDIEDSRWNGLTFATDIKSIFLESQIGDIGPDFAIFRWPAGESATSIKLTPVGGGSSVTALVTEDNVRDGVIKVEGLKAATTYNAILSSGTRRIGKAAVTTIKEGTVIVRPGDDLLSLLTSAEDGDAFLITPGDYLPAGTKVNISKSISISGYGENNRPVIHAHFEVGTVASLTLQYLTLDGTRSDETLLDHTLQFMTSGNCGKINVDGCVIKNYNKSLVAGASGIAVKIESLIINNCIVSNILTNSADCIDIRSGFVQELKLTNSTFNNCAPARDFIRLDDASAAFPGQTSKVLIDRCTLYRVSDDLTRRILYVRFVQNTLTVSNTIISTTKGYYTNSTASAQPECYRNNYHNAPGFLAESNINITAKYDISGTYTLLDPGFVNTATGNFNVTNEELRNKKIGDPRWVE